MANSVAVATYPPTFNLLHTISYPKVFSKTMATGAFVPDWVKSAV